MKRSAVATIPLSLCLMLATAASAQAPPEAPLAPSNGAASFGTELRDEFLGHFERSSYKISELARVMPEDLYTWAPGEGLMEVAEVYMHLARYNFMYLDENLGIASPIPYADLESIRDKERVREIFARSVDHVNASAAAMTEAALDAETRLYGREVPGWAVLFQLLSHMNEHVGQSVAYARMNDVAPPWSR